MKFTDAVVLESVFPTCTPIEVFLATQCVAVA